MKFLVWDTSSRVGVLAAFQSEEKEGQPLSWEDFRLVNEWTLNVEITHS